MVKRDDDFEPADLGDVLSELSDILSVNYEIRDAVQSNAEQMGDGSQRFQDSVKRLLSGIQFAVWVGVSVFIAYMVHRW